MKGIVKIIPVAFILAGLIVQSLGCASAEAQTGEGQVVTVQRGDLRVDITAAGNLALSRTEDLAFDIFYPEATVEEVLVEEGDTVEEGQVLARLDEDEWDEELSELEDELATAKRQLRDARLQIPAKEIALLEAQVNLEQAEYNLEQVEDVEEAQDAIDDAELRLECVKLILLGGMGGGVPNFDYGYWQQLKTRAEQELDEAEEDLQNILEDISITVSRDVALDVAKKQLLVEQKQMALEDAQLDVEDAQTDAEDAQEDVDDAQEEWEDAESKSPAITAPFAGFITRVNVEGGDEVMTGAVAVQLADPDQFEAEIMVSEMDISQVKEGGDARVEVDALSGLTLPAEVTHIAPTATIQSGVVNYKVKVEVASLEEMIQERQAARQEATEKIQQGELPEHLKQAIESGQITQEQA
jgi:HlyD family secretion protein